MKKILLLLIITNIYAEYIRTAGIIKKQKIKECPKWTEVLNAKSKMYKTDIYICEDKKKKSYNIKSSYDNFK